MTTTNQNDCQATTAKGTECTRNAVDGSIFCRQHATHVERVEEEPIPTVCASCIDAFEEEFAGFFEEQADRELACIDYGADMPDHFCEQFESAERCACGCGDPLPLAEAADPCVDCSNPETTVGAAGYRRCEPCYVAYKELAFVYSKPGDVYATDNPLYQIPEQRGHSGLCHQAEPTCATCGERICALDCPRFTSKVDILHAYGRCQSRNSETVPVPMTKPDTRTIEIDPELPADWATWTPGRKAAWTRKNRPGQTTGGGRKTEVDSDYYHTQPANWNTLSAGKKAAWTRKHRQLTGA